MSKHLQFEWDDIASEPFYLIEIHTADAPHKVAYFLNKILDIRLERLTDFCPFPEKASLRFPYFKFQDTHTQAHFELVGNKQVQTQLPPNVASTLFSTPITQEKSMLTEFKKADYLLKIEAFALTVEGAQIITKKVQNLNQVISASLHTHDTLNLETLITFENAPHKTH